MKNKYIIHVAYDNTILAVANTFDYTDNDIEISEEEYNIASKYKKFDIETRTFAELIGEHENATEITHEEITREMHNITQVSAEDNLLNMDLLTAVDEKLNLIIEHLGLNG